MGKPWKWWYQILPQHSHYEAEADWKTVSDECAREHKTVAGWYLQKEMYKRGSYYFPIVGEDGAVKKVQKIHMVTVWERHPDRAVRIRWGKIHRAMVRLFRHGELAWYRHERDGTLRFETMGEVRDMGNVQPIPRISDKPPMNWQQEWSPDTMEERKHDKRWDELQYKTYAFKRNMMGLRPAEQYETKVSSMSEHVIYFDSAGDRHIVSVEEAVGQKRMREKQNLADLRRASTDAKGMCGTWTSEDGGAWRKHTRPAVVTGRTREELLAKIRADKAAEDKP
jgi:hypothetical protein